MKSRLTEHSERKPETEFDPPPLLEINVELKLVGLKKDKRFYLKSELLTKSGGGFNTRSGIYGRKPVEG